LIDLKVNLVINISASGELSIYNLRSLTVKWF